MDAELFGHKIGAWKLAGHFDGLYYAFIDDMVDFDIRPSKYPRVVLRRITREWATRFMFERHLTVSDDFQDLIWKEN